jgi:hypothetical protein
MEESHSESEIEVEKIPLGIRLTLQFLRLLMVVMVFPLLGACMLAFLSLIVGVLPTASFPRAMVLSLSGLGSFIGMLSLMTGAAWMECHLNQSPVPFATAWVAGRPDHPARKLILPAVGSIACYGYAAVLLWLAVHVGSISEGTFLGWPIIWGSVAVAATLLHRYLKAKLPG